MWELVEGAAGIAAVEEAKRLRARRSAVRWSWRSDRVGLKGARGKGVNGGLRMSEKNIQKSSVQQ